MSKFAQKFYGTVACLVLAEICLQFYLCILKHCVYSCMHPDPHLYFLFVHFKKKMFVCVDACLGFLQFIDQEGNGDIHTDESTPEPSVSPWHKRGAPPPPGWNDFFGDQVPPSAPQDHGRSDTNTSYPPPPGMIGMPTPEAWGGPPQPGGNPSPYPPAAGYPPGPGFGYGDGYGGGGGGQAPTAPPGQNPTGTINMDTNSILFQFMALDDVSLHCTEMLTLKKPDYYGKYRSIKTLIFFQINN